MAKMKMMKSLPQPEKVLIAGDWHGDLAWGFKVVNYARSVGADAIVHAGDFGFGNPGSPVARAFLRELNAELDHCGVTLYWVDGNHDYQPALHAINRDMAHAAHVFFSECPRIVFLPRGFRWSWW